MIFPMMNLLMLDPNVVIAMIEDIVAKVIIHPNDEEAANVNERENMNANGNMNEVHHIIDHEIIITDMMTAVKLHNQKKIQGLKHGHQVMIEKDHHNILAVDHVEDEIKEDMIIGIIVGGIKIREMVVQ
mmetsp:Transcript_120012/g.179294  ORF Transcript_120012/g.179294 Transcript_120012/m.179294 type:complete len:129 (+) Transcript_120012:276-662(+)